MAYDERARGKEGEEARVADSARIRRHRRATEVVAACGGEETSGSAEHGCNCTFGSTCGSDDRFDERKRTAVFFVIIIIFFFFGVVVVAYVGVALDFDVVFSFSFIIFFVLIFFVIIFFVLICAVDSVGGLDSFGRSEYTGAEAGEGGGWIGGCCEHSEEYEGHGDIGDESVGREERGVDFAGDFEGDGARREKTGDNDTSGDFGRGWTGIAFV